MQCGGTITETGFKHNTAANGGAAFLNDADIFLVLHSNFTGNNGSRGGGGLQIQTSKHAQVSGNIFRRCVAQRGFGGLGLGV